MINRPRRQISQATYLLLQDIARENDRQRQVDRGLGYRRAAVQVRHGVEQPLHIGATIEAVPVEDGWAA